MTRQDNSNDSDIFGSLFQDTQSKIDVMATGPVDVASELEVLQRESEEVSQITDEQQRLKREEILAAKFDTLRESVKADEGDMAKAMFGMKVLMESLGADFHDLKGLTTEEQEIIDDAKSKAEQAKLKATTSKQAISDEENDNGWFGLGWGKTGRVEKAQQTFKASKVALAMAEAGILTAQQRANEMLRDRIMSANIESTLNEIQVAGEKTVSIMQERASSLSTTLKTLQARKEKAFEIKLEASKRVESLLEEEKQQESELHGEELALDSYTGHEKTQHGKKVSQMRTELEDLRGKLKVAQAVLGEKTKSIQEHENFELGQQKLLSNHRMWIATLQSKLQEDLVKDVAYLEMLQAAADQEIAQTVDSLSDEKNARQMETVMKMIVASDDAYIGKMKAAPEQVKRRANIERAMAEHKANISEEEAVLRELFIKNYGIDPLQSSQFTHANDNSGASNEADDTPPASPEKTVNVSDSEALFGS